MLNSIFELNFHKSIFHGNAIASDPTVFKIDSSYYMLYTDLNGATGSTIISLVQSTDGVEWSPVDTGSTLPGALIFDSDASAKSFETAEILKTESGHVVLVSSYDTGKPFPASLYAYSLGNDMSVAPLGAKPVLEPTAGWYDNDAIYSPAVVAHKGGYVMYYVGHAYENTGLIEQGGVYLLAASSPDGVTWTKHPEPILSPGDGPAWASDGFAEPDLVIGPDGTVHLFFTGLSGEERVLGYASATEPFGEFQIAQEPILTPDMLAGADATQLLAPTVLLEGNTASIWYLAYGSDGSYSIARTDATMDTLLPPAEDLVLSGSRGDDRLIGGLGEDTLEGYAGDDWLEGGAGDDTLIGHRGADTLMGGDGNDRLEGRKGHDLLNGGGGDDMLIGGLGQDTFIFGDNFGTDIIDDFDIARDTIEFALSESAYSAFNLDLVDDSVRLWFGEDNVTLVGIDFDEIAQVHFVFG